MWAVFDLETTGLDIKKDRIIEYAIVIYDPEHKAIMASTSQLVCDEETVVPLEIVELTGIKYDMLAKRACTYLKFSDIISSWFTGPHITHVVAHNATQFDVPLVQMEFIRQGKAAPDFKVIDTYTDVPYPAKIKNRSLSYLAADHGFLNPWGHRALADTLTLIKILEQYDHRDIEFRAASPTLILEAKVTYDEREKAKEAGFRWNPAQKKWTKSVKQFEVEKTVYAFEVQQVMM